MRQRSSSTPPKNHFGWILATLLLSLALTACGGGGEAEEDGTAAPASSTASDGSGGNPAPPSTSPTFKAEIPLINELPQAGSSSAIGNGVEGLWLAPASSGTTGFAFIGPDGRYLGFLASPSTYPAVFEGSVTLAGTSWRFAADSAWSISDGVSGYSTRLFGSGSVMPRRFFEGGYATGSADARSQRLSYQYAAANALAATQAEVAGAWTGEDLFLFVDAQGVVQGRTRGDVFGDCALGGTVTHVEPATHKNLFTLTLNASPLDGNEEMRGAATVRCRLDAQPLGGYAAITLVGTTGPAVRRQALKLLVKNGTRSIMTELERDASPEVFR